MTRLKSLTQALSTAALLALPVAAHADLSQQDIDLIDGKSGIRVVSSDGAFLGTTNGLSVRGERTRLFLLARSGSVFSRVSPYVNITTFTDKLTLNGATLVLDEDRQAVRVRAKKFSIDDDIVEITLLTR